MRGLRSSSTGKLQRYPVSSAEVEGALEVSLIGLLLILHPRNHGPASIVITSRKIPNKMKMETGFVKTVVKFYQIATQ